MPLNAMLASAIATGSLVVALFFLRYWRTTRDRFFLYFAVSFALEAVSRIFLGLNSAPGEDSPEFYLPRLAAYVLILIAIIDKNWRPKRHRRDTP